MRGEDDGSERGEKSGVARKEVNVAETLKCHRAAYILYMYMYIYTYIYRFEKKQKRSEKRIKIIDKLETISSAPPKSRYTIHI